MSSASSATLLISSVLLVLLHGRGVHCLSVGQLCNVHIPDQCDPGLVCVALGADAYCRAEGRDPCGTAVCPEPECRPNLQYTPEGSCCPLCPPQPTAYIYPAGCTVDGVHRNEGETWKNDSCTTCTCVDGQSLCTAVSCQPLACTNLVQVPGECCPTCLQLSLIQPAPLSNKCIVNGQEHEDGERWRPLNGDRCERAYCDQGEVLRYSHQCQEPQCDNPVFHEDICCATCPDSVDVNVERPTATEPTPAPECKVEDGVVLKDREWHCPAPNVTIYCNAGVKETTNHCPSLDCVNVIRGPNMCDCPMCIYDAHQFVVGGRLRMSRFQFAFKAWNTDRMLKQLARDSGLFPQYINFNNCNNMVCLKMSVLSPIMTDTEADVVEAVRTELNSKNHAGLEIGYVGEFEERSKRSVDDAPQFHALSLTSSSASSDRHGSVVATTIAVSASVLGVVGSVVGVALLASFVRRRRTVRSTITV